MKKNLVEIALHLIPRIVACVALSTPFLSGHVAAQTANKQNGQAVEWPSIVCRISKCEPLTAKGWLYAKPGQKSVVIISHGSVGIDSRVFDRVDQLQSAGIAALVIDHWGSRGLNEILSGLADAPSKGASELNMAFDVYTAAHMLRQEPYDFDKVGAIGASYGGGAQITMQQKWAADVIEKTMTYWYKKPFVVRPLDAQVALYGFCGYRNKIRDQFNGAPILFINGDKDDMTPAPYCEHLVSWMNERGDHGNAKFVLLHGAYHGFDEHDRAVFIPHVKQMAKCDLVADTDGITDMTTGDLTPGNGSDVQVLLKAISKCGNTWGFWSGNNGHPEEAEHIWLPFFQQQFGQN